MKCHQFIPRYQIQAGEYISTKKMVLLKWWSTSYHYYLIWLSYAGEESESDNNIFNYNGYDSLGARINTGSLKLIVNDPDISGEWQLTMIGNVDNAGSQFFSGSLNGIVMDDIHYHINLNSMIADDNVNLEGIFYLW